MKMLRLLKPLKAIPFTHSTLSSILSDYKNPNDKIRQMVKNGDIIRIKQGLYVSNEIYHGKKVSDGVLANLIYGPSYVSMDYALSFYRLIPERVYEVTSVTTKMVKNYNTPFKRFTYIKSPKCLYQIGMTLQQSSDNTNYMMATLEKALCDKILFTQNLKITSIKGMIEYLEYDLRINLDDLEDFDINIADRCLQCGYKIKQLKFLYKAIKKIQGA